MTPSTLPNKLWRPLSEVKSLVEKMPEGIIVADITRKIGCFRELSKAERKKLIDFLEARESVFVIKIKRESNAYATTLLKHKKYGYPKSFEGIEIIKKANHKTCSKCHRIKALSEFYVNNSKFDGLQSYCKDCTKKSTLSRPEENHSNHAEPIFNANQELKESVMTSEAISISPESLRKQAEELLRAAEEAEKKRNETDFFNKKLQPVKLEIFQAAGKMQRKLDEFIDCMDEMNKALQKLKELSA